MLTGAMLYAGPFSALVGRRELVRTIHVRGGDRASPAVPPGGRRPFRDSTAAGRHPPEPLATRGRHLAAPSGRRRRREVQCRPEVERDVPRPHAVVVMLMTGIMMKWFTLVSLDWRTGATFVHDWFALGIWFSVGGHVMFATRDPIALRSMWRGSVPAQWARLHRPQWYEEETGRRAAPTSPGS